MNINDFTVRMPKRVVPLLIIGDIFIFGLIMLLLIDNPILPSIEDGPEKLLIFFLVLYAPASIFALVLFSRWKIHVKDNKFYFCPGIGPSRHFTLDDIRRIKYSKTDHKLELITLYSEDKILASAKSNSRGYSLLLELLLREGLLHKDQKLSQDIVDVRKKDTIHESI